MALSEVTSEEAAKRLAQIPNRALDSIEALSESVRAEVHARRRAPRATTLSRVARLLAPVVSVETDRLVDVCDALEREGDVMLAPGGILHATPTRAVILEASARLFGSVPTRALTTLLGREVIAKGGTRLVASPDGVAETMATIDGAVITPEAWAGLDRTPPADAAFLAALGQRLEWQCRSAGSLERDGALDWRTWCSTQQGMGWRYGDEGRLWWARARFGGHHRAWTEGGAPSTSRYVELGADDADRARFALSREVTDALRLRVTSSGERFTLEMPAWLPRPEYRWLSLRAVPAPDCKGLTWKVSAEDEPMITNMLTERLGLIAEVS